MIEKLLENWLDSASERSYQPVFVQMLAAQGYSVVHSTRHSALEFGKDVLAIAKDGRGCAFQLKGHPGGKLGLREFRDSIQPQLVQMASQAIVYPGFPAGRHRSYLVSNGYFDEEVHRAVDDLNRARYRSKIELISRGHLISWAKKLGTTLWPTELSDSRKLLELMLANPKGPFPTKDLGILLGRLLFEQKTKGKAFNKAEFDRQCASAALLTGIAANSFSKAENHYAVVAAWTLCCVTIVGACTRHRIRIRGSIGETFALGEGIIDDALVDLWNEVRTRKYLVESNVLADPEAYGWRQGILAALLTALWYRWDSPNSNASRAGIDGAELSTWLRERPRIDLWGEAAVAIVLPWLVWQFKEDPTQRPENNLGSMIATLIARNARNSKAPLPSPYYDYEEILRSRIRVLRDHRSERIVEESFAGGAYLAMPLFHALIKAGLKKTCQLHWSEYSKLTHRSFRVASVWEYCTLQSHGGDDVSHIVPITGNWGRLREEATKVRGDEVPEQLASRPYLLALWWLVAPHRATPEAARVLSRGLHPSWGT